MGSSFENAVQPSVSLRGWLDLFCRVGDCGLCLVHYCLTGVLEHMAQLACSLRRRFLHALTQFGRGLHGNAQGRFRLVGYYRQAVLLDLGGTQDRAGE